MKKEILEESAKETVEAAAERYVEDFDLSFYDTVKEIPVKERGKKDFIAGANWHKEQSLNFTMEVLEYIIQNNAGVYLISKYRELQEELKNLKKYVD